MSMVTTLAPPARSSPASVDDARASPEKTTSALNSPPLCAPPWGGVARAPSGVPAGAWPGAPSSCATRALSRAAPLR
eukprot:1679794-Pleurochrysis_carterae.AAC.1